jgi:hypothetical protein
MTPVALLMAFVSAAPVPPATKAEKHLAALERKLHGEWVGDGPCQGGLTLRPDGTYRRTHRGPGGVGSAGTWAVRWNALPPTLTLRCRTSDDPGHEGTVRAVKLVELDDDVLAYQHLVDPKPTRYSRAKK